MQQAGPVAIHTGSRRLSLLMRRGENAEPQKGVALYLTTNTGEPVALYESSDSPK